MYQGFTYFSKSAKRPSKTVTRSFYERRIRVTPTLRLKVANWRAECSHGWCCSSLYLQCKNLGHPNVRTYELGSFQQEDKAQSQLVYPHTTIREVTC